ncbi:MAG: phosphomannomutase [Parcubacteria group bacterium Gr01-1014_106]|nr:MAG: phosphomannomutase [Parcubacteria group bacterium Gr01-1014_106]
MPFTPGIYRSYDIRGVVPDELDATDAETIGRAFVTFLTGDRGQGTGSRLTVLVARDMRTTGPELHAALVRGLTQQGADVVDVGMATTPLFYYSVWQSKADAGVMVSASHNPGKYNGFKMTREQAKPISKDTGLLAIRDLVEKMSFRGAEDDEAIASSRGLLRSARNDETGRVGTVSAADFSDSYLDYATAGAEQIGSLRVVIDAGNGMGGLLLPRVLERMPQLQATRMFFELDGSFPNHEANPLKEENMHALQERVKTEKAQIGIAFDGDADRVGFTDEHGVTVPGDLITALISQEVLREKPGATILYDLRSSWATKEAIEAAGGIPKMSRVGHSYIKELMRKETAAFAGEMSSHFYFQEYYAESAIRAMVLLLRLMSESGQSLSQLVAPLQKYAKIPETNFEIEDKASILAEVKRRYTDGKQFELDGLSVEYADWWFNLRASGTEPLLRLNMEARTPELLEQKKTELYAVLGEPSQH